MFLSFIDRHYIHFISMCSNDNFTATTRSIVTDYFDWRLGNQTPTNNRLFFIVRKIANDCETKYYSEQPTFNFHFSTLLDLENVHREIARELFNDGIITWTRIITFISFSAILAERFIQQQPNIDLVVSTITDCTTNFIDSDLHTWLKSQNYWVSYLPSTRIFKSTFIFQRLDA